MFQNVNLPPKFNYYITVIQLDIPNIYKTKLFDELKSSYKSRIHYKTTPFTGKLYVPNEQPAFKIFIK